MHGRRTFEAGNTLRARPRQAGLTLISCLVVAALSVLLLYLGARILPSYAEYGKVVKIMRDAASDFRPGETTPYALREQLTRQLVAADIANVKTRDFRIQRTRGGTTLSVRYEVPIYIFGSLGVVAKFDRSVPLGPKPVATAARAPKQY